MKSDEIFYVNMNCSLAIIGNNYSKKEDKSKQTKQQLIYITPNGQLFHVQTKAWAFSRTEWTSDIFNKHY